MMGRKRGGEVGIWW